jgi:hypothetical protein
LANNATLTLSTDWTRQFNTLLTYNNGFYDFQNSGTTPANFATQGASQAGLLDRIDQSIAADLRWTVAPEWIALIGYQFEWVDYTANEPIAQATATTYFYSNERNNYSHFAYLGFQSTVLPNLSLAVKAGAQITDDYNDALSPTDITPYLVSTASYTYAPGSYVQLGITHEQNATDVATPGSNGNVTQSQQSTVFSASVNHQITDKLTGSVIASIQDSTYYQGAYNNNSDWEYGLGVNLNYAINQHFSTEVGYNFDDYQSNAQPGYSRNRVYLGVTAAY